MLELPAILEGLNTPQKMAVMHQEGPLIIIAGPGTGKTLTMVRRMAYLVYKGVKPHNILALTFTNRAAHEMRERAEAFLGDLAKSIFIGTIHLLGLKIIHETACERPVLYNREEQLRLMEGLTRGLSISALDAVSFVSKIKNLGVEPELAQKELYEAYCSTLDEKGAIDFDDLILIPIKILGRKGMLGTYQRRFSHILIDEYQDINPPQYRLHKLIAGDGGNICVVGDVDQAIYAFRGADIENFLNFERDFPGAKRVVLSHNFRSGPYIIRASDALIKNNKRRFDKPSIPIKEEGEKIKVVSVPDERAEGTYIVEVIESRIGGTSHLRLYGGIKGKKEAISNHYGFGDFAILFRTNRQAKVIEEAFLASGIPYQVPGRGFEEERQGIKGMIRQILDALPDIGPETPLSPEEKARVSEAICKASPDKLSGDIRMAWLESLSSYLEGIDNLTLSWLINALSLFMPQDDIDLKADRVTLMTLHMAKGLEFKTVFIAGVEEGLIPYHLKKYDLDIEEERRLFYVGMTRAKEELFLINARSRYLYGKRGPARPSAFLDEIPTDAIEMVSLPYNQKGHKEKRQMRLF